MREYLTNLLTSKGLTKADFARSWGGSYAVTPNVGGAKLINHTLSSPHVTVINIIKAAKILGVPVSKLVTVYRRDTQK